MNDELRKALDAHYEAMHVRSRQKASTQFAYSRPVLSDALAVHPKQVKEAIEDARKRGVPTEFAPDGRPLIRSRQHRNAYLRAYGFHDRDAGYSDPAPGNWKGTTHSIPDPLSGY